MATTTASTPSAASAPAASTGTMTSAGSRLLSLDALRGFDMFWILGADAFVHALSRMDQNSFTRFLKDQLDHAKWEGMRFYDLIFPLFVFMVGVSLVISLRKTIERSGRMDAVLRIFRRSAVLFLLGIFYYGGLMSPWPNVRLTGVLQRIAIAYFVSGLLFCFCKPRVLAGVFVAILIGYWAMMTFIPVRDIALEKTSLAKLAEKQGNHELARELGNVGHSLASNPSCVKDSPVMAGVAKMFYETTNCVTHSYAVGRNLSCHFDFEYLPGYKSEAFWDNQTLLGDIPAIATCLLGVFAGLLLMNASVSDANKVLWLIGAGAAASAVGWTWGIQFPVIKKMWSSTYVLVAGGYSLMLLGVFYLIVDVWKKQTWCQPFIWIGMNPITLYLADNMLMGHYDPGQDAGFNNVSARFFGGDVAAFFDAHVAKGFGDMVVALAGLGLAIWLARFLYKRKVFIRI